MFNVFPSPSAAAWSNRPEFLVVRRITGGEAGNFDYTDDLTVVGGSISKTRMISGVDIMIAPVTGLRGELCVAQEAGRFDAALVGGNSNYLDWQLPYTLTAEHLSHTQYIVAAGLDGKTTRKQNWDACLATVRALRIHRPTVYAQFLSWQKMQSKAEPVQ